MISGDDIWGMGRLVEVENENLPRNNPRANGAKRRSGRKPGARVTNSARLFTPG